MKLPQELAFYWFLWYNDIHMKTQVTIQYEGGQKGIFASKEEFTFWLVLLILAASTLLFGSLLGDKTLIQRLRPEAQLGSIGSAIVGQSNSAEIISSASTSSESEVGSRVDTSITSPTKENTEITDSQAQENLLLNQQIRNVNDEINTQDILIIRLNQEMKLVKEVSVKLISDFDSNCGNWNDVCGEKISHDLDEHNTHYDELVKELTTAENAKLSAEERRHLLMSPQ